MIDKMPGDDVFLIWQKLQIATRMSLRDTPNEILFIWTKTQPSMSLIGTVIATLMRYRQIASSDSMQHALAYLQSTNLRTVVEPYHLTQQFAIDLEQAFSLLFQLSRNRLFEARYRLRTQAELHDYLNVWVTSLANIPARVFTSDGEEISTNSPDEIEIGFERVQA